MPQARRIPLTFLLSLFAIAAGADVHPNTEGGLAVNQAVEAGDIDNVNLFNGVLTLAIPLGISYPVGGSLAYRFTLLYNANPWMYTNSPDGHARSAPSTCGNAGLGWRVSFGAITPSTCVETDNTANSAGRFAALAVRQPPPR